jgi:predicted Rossmann fold nucleotide-binding protein DprA/Smf involved in DNA uptake
MNRGGPGEAAPECTVLARNGAKHSQKSPPAQGIIGKKYPEIPGHKDDGAGRDAAEAFRPKVGRRRQEALDGLGDEPITADELAARIGRPTYITRPRLTELLAMGLVVKAEGRGTSEFGAPATLWRRATPEERALFNARKAVLDEKSGVDA